jgi:hypothetical protein
MVVEQFRGEVSGRAVHDRRMLARMASSFVPDLTNVNRILKQGIERAARQGGPARLDSALGDTAFGADAAAVEFVFEQSHAAEFTIAREDLFNRYGFVLIYLSSCRLRTS